VTVHGEALQTVDEGQGYVITATTATGFATTASLILVMCIVPAERLQLLVG
jgi:hypothetical protein